MKRLILFLIISVFLLRPSLKAEEISLSLDETVIIALRDNRDILLKAEEVKKAKEKIAEAKAGLLPTLNFTGGRTYTRGYYAKDLGQTTTQVSLKQYLYKGGETINTIGQNKYNLEVSQALLDKAKLETVLNVKKAFYTILLAAEFVDLNQAILENTREHLNSLKARYKNGEVSESDLLRVESSLSNVQSAYEASLNQLESARALLNNLLYLDANVRIKPSAQFNYSPQEVSYDEAFLKAMNSRPEIRQYEAQGKADKKAIEIAKADNRPNIYASWDYYSRSTTSLTFSPGKGWQDYNIIGLTFSWPIFDGWATKAKVEQAIVDLKETQLIKAKIVKDIALELKNACLSLINAIAGIQAAESDFKLYEDNLLAMKDKYNQGIASDLDLNDAVLQNKVSLFNRKQSIYDYIIAKSSFDKTTGGI